MVERWILDSKPKYRYMLLDRMRQDCNYYLGNGGRNPKNLCAGSVAQQLEEMKAIWNSFPDDDKPEWITWDDILEYERQMKGDDRDG